MPLEQDIVSPVMVPVNKYVSEFISEICSRIEIEAKELEELWTKVSGSQVKSKRAPKKTEKSTDNGDKKTCIHKFERGARKDQSCGSKVCEESTTGKYCKRHISDEGGDKKTKTTKTETKKPKNSKKEAAEETTPVISKMQTNLPTNRVKKNAKGNTIHEETGIVFRLVDGTQKAYGKENKNGSIDSLTAEDIVTCRKFSFPYEMPDKLTKTEDDNTEVSEPDASEDEVEDGEEVVDE